MHIDLLEIIRTESNC